MDATDKAALRAEMRAMRKRLAEASPQAADRAAEYAPRLPPGEIVAVYCAMGSELDPAPLATALMALGRRLCLPVVTQREAPMVFRLWSPGDPLETDAAGCPAPLSLVEIVDPDLIITPLLAFDDLGGRLGQGGGYYDRSFAARPKAVRVGLAYAGQRVDELVLDVYDQRLDGVLSETGPRMFGISR